MFQLLPCSVCQRTFSLRKDVPEDSLLKCPNCGNQFRLGDVLDAYYGPWIVLGESVPASQPELHTLASRPGEDSPIGAPTDAKLSFDNLMQTHDEPGAEYGSRDNAVTDDVSELAADNVFDSNDLELTDALAADPEALSDDGGSDLALEDMQDDDGPVAINSHQFESPMDAYASPVESFESPKPAVKKMRASRGDKGGLWSIIQVVLGGAAAIPVTLGLLWYVLGKDVMNAGPTVAQYVPWIVPQKFHHPSENIAVHSSEPRVPPPALGAGGFRNFDEELGKSAPTSIDQPSPTAEAEVSSTDQPGTPAAAVPNDGTGITSAIETVRLTKEKMKGWDASAPDKTATANELFADLVLLSEQLTGFPVDGGAIRVVKDDLNDIGRALAAKESEPLRRAFASLQASQFSDKSKPERPGRIYLGRATEVSEIKGQWVITLKEGAKQLRIEAPRQAITSLNAGERFFCLGTVIEDSESRPEAGAPTIIRISASFLQTF